MRNFSLSIAALGLLAACGEDEEPAAEPDVIACELIKKTATAITASTARAAAPKITFGETPYQAALDQAAPTFVALELPGDQHGVLFFSADNVATGRVFLGDTELELEGSGANENCQAEIPDHYHVELDDAGTYAVELSPSAIAPKILLLKEVGEHE